LNIEVNPQKTWIVMTKTKYY